MATYKPKEAKAVVGGNNITGAADGEWAVIEWADEGNRMVVGADGESTDVEPSDSSGTLTLTLKQDSDSNGVLGALKTAGTEVEATFRDNFGTTYTSLGCKIKQHANANYAAKELSNRVWIINMPNIIPTYPTGTTPAT